ncbi:MAG: sodium:proton antiporter, partial [Candidatus Kryptoniota bacterium]
GALSSILDNTPTYLNFLSAASGAFVNGETLPLIQSSGSAFYHSGTYLLLTNHSTLCISQVHRTLVNLHPAVYNAGTLSDATITYLLQTKSTIVKAISVGAVFFGAMTYIGNGPNFMVKKIAEESGVRCPSFTNYILHYSIPVLLPVLILVWFFFFS